MELSRDAGRLFCPEGHSFDIARSGYVNLLQPQDRRSKQPGDSCAAVAARRGLHDRGVTGPLFAAIAEILEPRRDDSVLDAGCGEGFYLGSLVRKTGLSGHGIDISIPSIDAAARRFPECEWIVTNADRRLPYFDGSFSIVMSITARMNPGEFRRVLRSDGRLLIAIPGPQDLIELRGAARHRDTRTITDFSERFTLATQRRVTTTVDLDETAVKDVLTSIYRPRATGIHAMSVTFSLDLLLFRPR